MNHPVHWKAKFNPFVYQDDGEESGSALSMKLPGKPGHSGDYKAPFRAATPPPNKRQRF